MTSFRAFYVIMTRDTVLIRTEEDFKWRQLKRMKDENKEKEQKGCAGLTQNLGPLARSCSADWLEEMPMLHPLIGLPLK